MIGDKRMCDNDSGQRTYGPTHATNDGATKGGCAKLEARDMGGRTNRSVITRLQSHSALLFNEKPVASVPAFLFEKALVRCFGRDQFAIDRHSKILSTPPRQIHRGMKRSRRVLLAQATGFFVVIATFVFWNGSGSRDERIARPVLPQEWRTASESTGESLAREKEWDGEAVFNIGENFRAATHLYLVQSVSRARMAC